MFSNDSLDYDLPIIESQANQTHRTFKIEEKCTTALTKFQGSILEPEGDSYVNIVGPNHVH